MKTLFALLPLFLFTYFTCSADERTVKVYTLKDGTVITADSTATIEADGKTYYIVKPLEDAQPKKSFESSQLVKVEDKKVPVSGGERVVKVYTLKDGSTIVADHVSTVESEGIRFYVVTPLGDSKKKAEFDSDQLVKVEEKTIGGTPSAQVATSTVTAPPVDDAPVIGLRPNAPEVANAAPNAQPVNPPAVVPQAPQQPVPANGGTRNYVEPYTGAGLGITPDTGSSNSNNSNNSNTRNFGGGWGYNPFNSYIGGGTYLAQPYVAFVPYVQPPIVIGNSGTLPNSYGMTDKAQKVPTTSSTASTSTSTSSSGGCHLWIDHSVSPSSTYPSPFTAPAPTPQSPHANVVPVPVQVQPQAKATPIPYANVPKVAVDVPAPSANPVPAPAPHANPSSQSCPKAAAPTPDVPAPAAPQVAVPAPVAPHAAVPALAAPKFAYPNTPGLAPAPKAALPAAPSPNNNNQNRGTGR